MSVRYEVYDLHTVATELAGKWTAAACIIRRHNMDVPVLSMTWGQEFATEAEARSFAISAAKGIVDSWKIRRRKPPPQRDVT